MERVVGDIYIILVTKVKNELNIVVETGFDEGLVIFEECRLPDVEVLRVFDRVRCKHTIELSWHVVLFSSQINEDVFFDMAFRTSGAGRIVKALHLELS